MLSGYGRKKQKSVQHVFKNAARFQAVDIKIPFCQSVADCSILQVFFHFFLLFLFSFSLFFRFPLFLTFLPALCCKRRKKRKERTEITALIQCAAFFKYAARHFSESTNIILKLRAFTLAAYLQHIAALFPMHAYVFSLPFCLAKQAGGAHEYP